MALAESNNEKKGGRKSRWTVPLKGYEFSPVALPLNMLAPRGAEFVFILLCHKTLYTSLLSHFRTRNVTQFRNMTSFLFRRDVLHVSQRQQQHGLQQPGG